MHFGNGDNGRDFTYVTEIAAGLLAAGFTADLVGQTVNLAIGRMITVQEVADLMRVSSMTVYRLIKAGELPAVRVGRSFRVSEPDVDAYLSSRYTQAG